MGQGANKSLEAGNGFDSKKGSQILSHAEREFIRSLRSLTPAAQQEILSKARAILMESGSQRKIHRPSEAFQEQRDMPE